MVTVKSTHKTSAPSETELSPSDAVFLSRFLDLFLTYSLVILQLFGWFFKHSSNSKINARFWYILRERKILGFWTLFLSYAWGLKNHPRLLAPYHVGLPQQTNICILNICLVPFVLPGSCQGVLNEVLVAASVNACIEQCTGNLECEWWIFDSSDNFCTLLSSCDSVDASCATCTSGQSGCEVGPPPSGGIKREMRKQRLKISQFQSLKVCLSIISHYIWLRRFWDSLIGKCSVYEVWNPGRTFHSSIEPHNLSIDVYDLQKVFFLRIWGNTILKYSVRVGLVRRGIVRGPCTVSKP